MRLLAALTLTMLYFTSAERTALAAPCKIAGIHLTLTGAYIGQTHILLNDGEAMAGGGALTWDEPMQIIHTDGSKCTVSDSVDIITKPMFLAGGKFLYVTTYSGSESLLYAVAIHDCSVQWKSPAFESGPSLSHQTFHFKGTSPVVIGDDCLPSRS